jgi:signal transduction histidine kinase
MANRFRIVSLAGLAIIPLVMCSALVIRNNTATHQARIVADRVSVARAAAQAVAAYIDGNLTTVRALALSPVVAAADQRGTVPDFLVSVVADNPDWEGIGLIREDGTTLTGSTSTSGTVNLADRPYFQDVIATGKPTVSEPIVGRIRGVVTVVLAAPIAFASGERGVLAVPLSLTRLDNELRELDGGTGAQLVVVDAAARVFVHPNPAAANQLVSIAGAPEVAAVQRGESGAQVTNRAADIVTGPDAARGGEQLAAYAPIRPFGWGVLSYGPADVAFAPVRSAFIGQLALLILAIIAVAATTTLLGRRLLGAYESTVRARLQAEEARATAEQAERRAEFLAWMSEELDRSLDYETALVQVAERAVPEFADWCAVDLVDDGGEIHRVAVAHGEPAAVPSEQDLPWRSSANPMAGARRVTETGEPLIANVISDEALDGYARNPEDLVLLRALNVASAIVVPMTARDRIFGALTLLGSGLRRPLDASDLDFALDAAARVALAVDNARLRADLERAVRTRDEYFAATSHDLRTPLTVIRSAAQMQGRLLRKLSEPDAAPLRPGLDAITAATSRLARLASGLLDLARLEVGRPLDLERSPTDLVALTRRMIAEAQHTSEDIAIELDTTEEIVGSWDTGRLERVIANLLDNAIKYSADSATVEVRIARNTSATRDAAVIEVRDYGLGIPAADLPHIFDPFRRGSNVAGQIAGTGLGLAGARHIVEEHGGTIAIESTLGKGTTVRVELPIEVTAAAPAPAPTSATQS